MTKYKVIQKYQLGYQNDFATNVAIISELVSNGKDGKTQTVVHAYDKPRLVLADLSAHYDLPEHIALYRVQPIANYDIFKKTGHAKLTEREHLFAYNKNTGMWDTRWPNIQLPRISARMSARIGRDTKWCVDSMLQDINTTPRRPKQSYIRPIAHNYPMRMATHTIHDPVYCPRETRLVQQAFTRAMKTAPQKMIVLDTTR